MKNGRTSGKGSSSNLLGLVSRNNNYHSFYDKNSNEIILNINVLNALINRFQLKENVTISNSDELIKFINNSIKEYLKNIIQKLIENNRRRTYPKYFSFSKQNKIISYGINVQRDPNPAINAKKNKFYHPKELTLMCTINVNKKLELLNQYNALKNNKEYKNDEEDEKSDMKKYDETNLEKREDNSDSSDSDFFQKKERKNTDEFNNKKEYEGIMNVYQSHELTTNKKMEFKKNRIGHIELKDLVYYLEENQTIPWSKNLLYKVYTEMTLSGNK